MSVQAKNAVKDVCPGIQEPLPPQLVSYCERLYGKSLLKHLPPNDNSARYHICAYLSVEKYMNTFNLPQPLLHRIPIAPKQLANYIPDFAMLTESMSPTPRNSPQRSPLKPITPSKRSHNTAFTDTSPGLVFSSPSGKSSTTPKRSSPLKLSLTSKFEAIRDQSSEDEPSSATSSPKKPKLQDDMISIPRLIQLCNTFYIPAFVTTNIIQEFINQRHKFAKKSDWYLACGLIYSCYIRINHKIVKTNPDSINTLVGLMCRQNNKLKKNNLVYYNASVESTIKDSAWVVDIENVYMYGVRNIKRQEKELNCMLGEGHELYDRLGSMINARSNLASESQKEYYETWSSRVLLQIE